MYLEIVRELERGQSEDKKEDSEIKRPALGPGLARGTPVLSKIDLNFFESFSRFDHAYGIHKLGVHTRLQRFA